MVFSYCSFSSHPTGHHECEILKGGPESEAAESGSRWKKCTKNAGHKEFMSVQDFKNKYLSRVQDDEERDTLRAMIDLTVKLTIKGTSRDRPNDNALFKHRGTKNLRCGTGFISHIYKPVSAELCPCDTCKGETIKKFWRFWLHTAAHVVYNTEEEMSTRVDLFYDDDSCKFDGRMVTVMGFEVLTSEDNKDTTYMECLPALAERIVSLRTSLDRVLKNGLHQGPTSLDFLPPCDGGSSPTLIVSHPHRKPKKIT